MTKGWLDFLGAGIPVWARSHPMHAFGYVDACGFKFDGGEGVGVIGSGDFFSIL